jgi:F-type H+-transporting ATPase subunit b
MPQFDPASWVPQLFWLGLVFAILYFAVVRPTLPKVGRVIDEREGRVAGDLDAAEAAKGEADAIRDRYDNGMAAARKTAQADVAAARDAAARAVAARLQELGGRLDAEAAAAAARLDTARDTARAGLAATAADLTVDAVRRLTGIVPAAAQVEAALAAQK